MLRLLFIRGCLDSHTIVPTMHSEVRIVDSIYQIETFQNHTIENNAAIRRKIEYISLTGLEL
jgi:hypothetical protein